MKSSDGYVDTQKTDRYVNFIKNQIDEVGDVWEFFYEQGTYDVDDIENYRDEIEQTARDMYDLDEDDDINEEQFESAIHEYVSNTGSFEIQLPEYDGIIWENVYDNISDKSALIQSVYVVFNPTQIKSASNNNGSYSHYTGNIYEYAEYFQQDDDIHQLTRVLRDENHDYEYCDGVLYELSHNGEDIIVGIDEIEATPENTFYQDQIDRYVEYIQNGGILETFPVDVSPLGSAYNLYSMIEYLFETENFDIMYEILNKYDKEFDYLKLDEILWDSEEFDMEDSDILKNVSNIDDLNKYYGEDYSDDYEEDEGYKWHNYLYSAFKDILDYWKDNKEYTLTDMNHRFKALKELDKKYVYVDPS